MRWYKPLKFKFTAIKNPREIAYEVSCTQADMLFEAEDLPVACGTIYKDGKRWSTGEVSGATYQTRDEAARCLLGQILDRQSKTIEAELSERRAENPHRDPKKLLTKAAADRVYTVLTTMCGANDANGWERSSFIDSHTEIRDGSREACVEWRFCGVLGFGGKFRNWGRSILVDCYSEDDNPMTRFVMARANLVLQRDIFEPSIIRGEF